MTTPQLTPGPSASPGATTAPPVVNGVDGQFSPAVGDTPSGGHGPAGTQIDNAQCQQSMSENYHIHVFIGLYVNGTEYALPRGIGVADPVNPNDPAINYATQCFYYTHTHDSTGVLHIEDYNSGMLETPPTTSNYTLKTFFDVWGITVDNTHFGQFAGPVRVYTSGQVYRGDQNYSTVPESTLTQWTGDPNQIPLYSHEVIWFFIGPPSTYPTSLPGVHFYEEY